jgi:hypothetical protein
MRHAPVGVRGRADRHGDRIAQLRSGGPRGARGSAVAAVAGHRLALAGGEGAVLATGRRERRGRALVATSGAERADQGR